jgi:hypothetical protein
MTKEELQRALECAERCRDIDGMYWWGDVVDSLKAALEAKDEPVAWQYRDANDDGTWTAWTGCDKQLTESDWRKVRPLYTTPQPQRQPVVFPTMLRKMWSGGEVQAWLDENVNKEKNT